MSGLLVLVLVEFRVFLFQGRVFFERDIHLAWLPQIEGFVRAVAAGAWPLWDPVPGFGQPLLADPSAQLLYPLTWLNLLMPPWAYYTLFAASHVFFSAVCLYRLARRWGLAPLGAFTSGVIWTFSGPFVSLVDLWHHFAGAAWMPAVILALDRAAERRDGFAVAGAGAALALQVLAGSADQVVLTLAVAGAALAARSLAEGRARGRTALRAVRSMWAVSGLAVIVAVGLTASLWLPALDVARRSARSELPPEVRSYWSVHPLGLAEVVLPGPWRLDGLSEALRQRLFEGREPFLDTLYLGLPALALAVLGAWAPHPRRVVLVACFVAAAAVALGRHAPVHDWLVTLLPPLGILRYPVKVTIVMALAWALLAGLGLDHLRGRWGPVSRRAVPAASAAVLVLAVGAAALAWGAGFRPAALAELLLDPEPARFAGEALAPLRARMAVAAAGGLLAVAARLLGADRRLALAWAAVAMAELFWQHRNPSPAAPREFYAYRPEALRFLAPPGRGRAFIHDYADTARNLRTLGRPHAFRARGSLDGASDDAASALSMQSCLVPESAGRWAVWQGFGNDYRGLFPKAVVQLGRALRDLEDTPLHARFLRVGGITHVVALHASAGKDLLHLGTVLTPDPLYVFGVPGTLPRAYAVTGTRVADGADAIRILADARFDLMREVVLPVGAGRVTAPGPPGEAHVVAERPDRVQIDVRLEQPGYLVLVDTYDPGWRATVDGSGAPVVPANTAFRAVAVPAGRHRVELVYRPRALAFGLGLSLATGLALGAILLLRSGSLPGQEGAQPEPGRERPRQLVEPEQRALERPRQE